MTTDITELAQSLKAAAEKATPGRIGDRIDGSGSIKYQCFGNDGSLVLQTDHKNMEYGFIGPNAEADELFFRECAPENILALVEALASEKRICATWRKTAEANSEKLEKAQQRIGKLEKKLTDHKRMNQEMAKAMLTPNDSDAAGMEIAALRQRIAELEREQEQLRPVGVMSEKAFHRLENSECRFIALWPRPGIFLQRKRPEDGVLVYARTAAAAGIKVEAE
ncbi:TPA: ead/Ea22-like family protein [Klebsiella pneumoniae]|nr:ead/Ea22-like family protein [Klebsiella pneumoniae]HBW1972822.1 ead/Ea22-like family protein [Klebsiella pneumoniae]HCB2179653.1 ead/Ea22-like family protein [Klebsiella pneumoniae]HCB3427298.1 ead/Ea22-like family protein [Klebsiella pneumoniae]HCB3514889.1 ead/Ea22-like family protein [Klebsiella pneumoniae]